MKSLYGLFKGISEGFFGTSVLHLSFFLFFLMLPQVSLTRSQTGSGIKPFPKGSGFTHVYTRAHTGAHTHTQLTPKVNIVLVGELDSHS